MRPLVYPTDVTPPPPASHRPSNDQSHIRGICHPHWYDSPLMCQPLFPQRGAWWWRQRCYLAFGAKSLVLTFQCRFLFPFAALVTDKRPRVLAISSQKARVFSNSCFSLHRQDFWHDFNSAFGRQVDKNIQIPAEPNTKPVFLLFHAWCCCQFVVCLLFSAFVSVGGVPVARQTPGCRVSTMYIAQRYIRQKFSRCFSTNLCCFVLWHSFWICEV